MKKYVLLAVILVSKMTILDATSHFDSLQDAVESANIPQIKELLRSVEPLEPKEKETLLRLAEDLVEEQKSRVSLLRSSLDVIKLVGGGLFGSLVFTLVPPHNDNKTAGFIRGCLLASPAFYIAYKGLICSTAQDRVDKATKVLMTLKTWSHIVS